MLLNYNLIFSDVAVNRKPFFRLIVIGSLIVIIIFGTIFRSIKKFLENRKDQNIIHSIGSVQSQENQLQFNNQGRNSPLLPGLRTVLLFSFILLQFLFIFGKKIFLEDSQKLDQLETVYVFGILVNLYSGFLFPFIMVIFNNKIVSHVKTLNQ